MVASETAAGPPRLCSGSPDKPSATRPAAAALLVAVAIAVMVALTATAEVVGGLTGARVLARTANAVPARVTGSSRPQHRCGNHNRNGSHREIPAICGASYLARWGTGYVVGRNATPRGSPSSGPAPPDGCLTPGEWLGLSASVFLLLTWARKYHQPHAFLVRVRETSGTWCSARDTEILHRYPSVGGQRRR